MSSVTMGDVQISLKTLNGDCFTVNVPRLEKIIDLKNKIAMETGLIPSDQILICGGTLLHEDDMKINEYSVLNGSVINVVARLRGGMMIVAKTLDGKTIAIEVQKTERIIDVKKKIQEMIGLAPKEQKLVFQGGILEDDETVEECGIVEKSLINIVVRLRGGMMIFAKTMDGKTVTIEVQKTDRIIDVKKKIQEKTGLAQEEQYLMFQGGILEDDKTVEECGIVEKSVINVVARLRGGPIIFVKTMNGKSFPVAVLKTKRIIDIKKLIQDETEIDTNEMVLIYHGFVLADERFIDECGIMNESAIEVYSKFKRHMELVVKTVDGKCYNIKVAKSGKIIDMKRQIQEVTGVASKEQTLIHKEFVLNDEQSVTESEIMETSEILLCTKLRFDMKINVRTNEGRNISIDTNKTEQVSSLKRKIQSQTGLRCEKQILIFNKIILEDEKIVEDCKLTSGSTVLVVID